jgi:hypothetical protein
MKLKTKRHNNGRPIVSNGKEFKSLEEVAEHFFPEERKKPLVSGKELGTELAEDVFAKLLKLSS